MSTKFARAPVWVIASVVAMNVWDTVTTTSPVRGVGELREVALESLHHRPADEARGSQRLLKDGDQFILDFFMKAD